MTLFDQYQEEETVKPLVRVGDFGLVKYQKPIKEKKKRGITNQRQFFMKEIQEIIEQENGGKMSKDQIKLLCMKLSHVPTEDLSFMKSEGLDYRNRQKKPFAKYIYGSVKPKKI